MLPPVAELASRAGVIFTEIAYSSFGVPWTKPTGLLHNTPSLHELSRKLWQDLPGPRVVLRGQVWFRGQWVFKTKLTQSYPTALGVAFGAFVNVAFEANRYAESLGVQVPMASKLYDDGLLVSW